MTRTTNLSSKTIIHSNQNFSSYLKKKKSAFSKMRLIWNSTTKRWYYYHRPLLKWVLAKTKIHNVNTFSIDGFQQHSGLGRCELSTVKQGLFPFHVHGCQNTTGPAAARGQQSAKHRLSLNLEPISDRNFRSLYRKIFWQLNSTSISYNFDNDSILFATPSRGKKSFCWHHTLARYCEWYRK